HQLEELPPGHRDRGAARAPCVRRDAVTLRGYIAPRKMSISPSRGPPLAPVAIPPLPPVSPLRGLLEVTARVRAGGDLLELLAAIARTVAESLGYEAVVINLYR